jgi:hypothetical protein
MTEVNGPTGLPEIPPPRKPTQWKIIIPVAIVVVLCCICLVVAGVLAYMGTQGNGPLAMLASPTPTQTPTRTPSPTPEMSVEGTWDLYYDWDCTGDYNGPATLTFYEDLTYSVYEGSSDTAYGTWFLVGDYIDFIFDESPNSNYVGTLSSDSSMEGTMDNTDGGSGCWYAER